MTSRIDYNNPHGQGALGLPYHYEMVSDRKRVVPFKKALQKAAKGRIVIESGCGTGIMSIYAAKAGAKAVYAVEIDPVIAEFAKRNFKGNKVDSRVKLLQKSTLDVQLPDLDGKKAGVIIAENLSTWQVTEPQIRVMNHINRYLAEPGAIRMPGKIFNYFELASSQYEFEGINIRTHYFEFTGIKKPAILSKRVLFQELDMSKIHPLEMKGDFTVKVEKTGTLNCLRLTSPLEIVKGVKFTASDSLMPPVIVPLAADLKVKKGDSLRIRVRFTTNTSWEDFQCDAEKIKAK